MLQERSQIHAQCWLLGHLRYLFIYVLGFGYKFVERETTVIFVSHFQLHPPEPISSMHRTSPKEVKTQKKSPYLWCNCLQKSLLNKDTGGILQQDSEKIPLCILHSDPLCYFPGSSNKHLKESNNCFSVKELSEILLATRSP